MSPFLMGWLGGVFCMFVDCCVAFWLVDRKSKR